MSTHTSSADYGRFEELAEEFAARFRRGERPSLQEYIDRCPDLADEIRELFPALVEVERAKEDQPERPGGAEVSAALPLLGQVGDYRVLSEVGRGGMGVVYEAEQVSLGRRVALKVLPRQVSSDLKTLARFRREARSAAQLHHTNIVPVFEVGKDGEVSYYAMQFIQGQGLDTVIEELRRLKDRVHPTGPAREPELPDPPVLSGTTAAAPPRARPVSLMAHSLLTGRFVPDTPGDPGEARIASANGTATAALSDPSDRDETEAPPASQPAPAAGSNPPSSVVLPGGSQLSAIESGRRPFYRSVAQIGRQVAAGLAYAHARGIVHRDIKPSNLLLDTEGVVWIADFGLAKASDDRLTQTGDILGTLRYMAPERFRGEGDGRADVYALGLTLYELLTLRPAFDSSDRLQLIEQIKTEDPQRLRALDPRIPRDLETIVLKAIAKDPESRYPSADALGEDLRRFLADEPIRARRVSVAERFGRWCRRNPAVAGLMAAVATLLIAVAIVATGFAIQYRLVSSKDERLLREAQSRAEAETKAKEELQASLYYQRISLADLELSQDNLGRARKQLDACPESLRQWEWKYLNRLCRLDPVILRDEAEVNSVAFSPDGERLAAAGGSRTIKVWNIRTREVLQALPANTDFVNSLAFHPGGNHLAAAGADRKVKVWDLTTAQEVCTPLPSSQGDPYQNAYVVAFSPDGRCLAVGCEGALDVWDWRNRQLLHHLPGHPNYRTFAVAFSPDGRRLASEGSGGVMIWDAETGEHLRTLSGHRARVTVIAFSPDGRRLATASFDRTIKLWDLDRPDQAPITLRGQDGKVNGVAFSPDGLRLASVGEGKTVRVWEVMTGREVLGLRGHTDMSLSVAFSPDGLRLASAGRDSTIRLWDATPLQRNERREVHTFYQEGSEASAAEGAPFMTLAISPDGQRVASAGEATHVKVWDLRSGLGCVEFTVTQSFAVFSVAWHPDGRRLCSSSAEGAGYIVRVRDAQARRVVFSLSPGRETFAVAFSPDGRHLVTGGANQTVQVWDVETGREVGTFGAHDRKIQGLAFSRDGRHLASASGDGMVKLWDWDANPLGKTQETRRTLRARAPEMGFNLAFSPDGRRLVAGAEENTVKIWDVQTGDNIKKLEGHKGDVWAAAFSPDPGGRWVASAGEDSTVKVWDSRTGALVRSFRGHTGVVTTVAFSPDGQFLVSGSRDGTVKVWDVTSLGKNPGE